MFEYLGLFVASFLASTILPFSSEALLAGMICLGYDPVIVVCVATIGNWLGGLTTYGLGYLGDWNKISKWLRIEKSKTDKYFLYANKYGWILGLLVWLPVIGDVIALAQGLAHTQFILTSVTILLGKMLRYIVLAYMVVSGIGMI